MGMCLMIIPINMYNVCNYLETERIRNNFCVPNQYKYNLYYMDITQYTNSYRY